jgi:hypothetical protein
MDGLLSTRRSNLIDIQYLYYTPFCEVFSTSDNFLKELTPLVLDADQSLVDGQELRQALETVAVRREEEKRPPGTGGSSPCVEPDEHSLIQLLWRKHRGRFQPQASSPPLTPEQSAQLMQEIKPIIDACDEASKKRAPNERWPQ